MRSGRGGAAAAVALAMLAVATVARAQTKGGSPGVELEARLDAILAHNSVLQGALGADIPISTAMRLELAAGAGPSFGNSIPGASVLTARGDAIVHFLIDPQHRMRWSPYAGGGIGARYDNPNWRAVAIVVAGVNAPRWKHAIPFIEAGFSGGIRIGAGLRRAP